MFPYSLVTTSKLFAPMQNQAFALCSHDLRQLLVEGLRTSRSEEPSLVLPMVSREDFFGYVGKMEKKMETTML